jgi:uncharacterized membrane protein
MKNPTDTQVFTAASAIGVISGMRAFLPPAVLAQIVRNGTLELDDSTLAKIGRPTTATAIALLSVGELIGDKLPTTPKRTKPVALIPRILSGAFCGALLCTAKRRSPIVGALAGAFGATGGTFAAYHLRKLGSESFDLPNPAAGAIEDGIAVGLAILITKSIA